MSTLKPYEFINPHEINSKPKQQNKPVASTEEIKHRLKLIEKAFR